MPGEEERSSRHYAASQTFRCYACKNSGDSIELVMRVRRLEGPKRQREAALMIQEHFHGYTPAPKGLPQRGLNYLEAEHEAVQSLGITADQARAIEIGFAPRGTMIKRVLFPLRMPDGRLVG